MHLPVLHLSYHYLPSALKQCFAYCSIYPKDHEFDKEELILLWAAQGFLGGSALQSGETIKDVGQTYFDELLSRSFFQQSGGYYSYFVMHDMMHDLAQFVSRNFCLTLDVEGQDKISGRTRHVSYIREEFDVSKRFDPLHRAHKLRTFLPLAKPFLSSSNISDKVLRDLLPTFGCLRVLSLSHYDITDLPDSFLNLKHLRHLNLSHTRIEKLPRSICVLLNLQSLLLSRCRELTELPAEIGKLINLIHLDVSQTRIQGMPVEIGKLINLIHLDVSETNIKGMPVEIGKLVNLLHLDISNTNLEGMPIEINKLKELRRLATFVVGKHSGASIAELRDLSHLQGALSILNLQNVVNAMDSFEANLKEKKGLDDLAFVWDRKHVVDGDLNNQTDVLEKLQPHSNVKRLRIQHYNGTKFPNWLGDPSFMNLVSLRLEDCSCSCLPPLGQLQSLKDLRIVKMKEVEKVGAEFYGNDGYSSSSSVKPFGSLEIVWFEEMLKWEEWVCCRVEFPRLKQLYIKKCPKLKGGIPKCLLQSTNIEITECGQLTCGLPLAPSIRELTLGECDDVVVRSAGGLTSLTFLEMRNVCKIPGELGKLHSLVMLLVSSCPELKEIPSIFHNFATLKHLEISQCKSLLSLSEMVVPPMLEILKISYCPILESLPEGLMQNNITLQQLNIHESEKLELSLDDQDMTQTHNHYASSLTNINIVDSCSSLLSFPLAFFTKLEHLRIWKCRNLKSLHIPNGLHHVYLTYLKSLNIWDCPELVSFPQEGLPTPNLRVLFISRCNKLKSLPQGMDTLLTSLQSLSIYDCPEIDSFPEGGLPSSLSQLDIFNCDKLMTPPMGWGLHTLPCLRNLRVKGYNKEQRLEESLIPEVDWFLPSSLIDLVIEDFPNLKYLHNKDLQHLTTLVISSFPNLKSLDDNEFQHLKSLETLQIRDCDKLKYLPKQGLPSSLYTLYLYNCPMLKKRCQRDKGKEWPKISHIPRIVFDRWDEERREVILS